MATIVNKLIRVISKKLKIKEVDCYALCSHLAETGGELWEKVIYYINEEENCLDIKYKSRKGRGELGIEDRHNDFDIWIIENYEGGFDKIHFPNSKIYKMEISTDTTNLYTFDEIRLKGNQEGLIKDFYPKFFHFGDNTSSSFFGRVLHCSKGDYVSLPVDGIYIAGTIYDVGKEFSRIPELQTKEEFHQPRNVLYWEAEFFILNYEVKKLIQGALKDKFSSFEWNQSNLSEIQFCYQSRMVKKIEIGKHWKYFNAEFFDNTVEKNWLGYSTLWKQDLI